MTAMDYKDLIKKFLENKITTKEFEDQFNNAFFSEPESIPEELYQIIGVFFEDVEAYSPNCNLDEETISIISESTLRKSAETTLHKLNEYLETHTE